MKHSWSLTLIAAAALAGCNHDSEPDDLATPVVTSMTIAGTAAKGVALGGAAVSVKCATGSGTATTAADGKYTLTLTGASLPCVLQATGTEGSVFRSVVPGTGTSGSHAANITPLSEMAVAQFAGVAPAAYFTAFGSTSTLSAATLSAALDYVRTAMTGTTDLTGLNPVTDTLVVGNPLDLKIDAVMAALARSGLTLAQVTAAIGANPMAPTVVTAPLAPKAVECAWLKSGKYRMINPNETDPKWKAHVISLDAVALRAVDQDGISLAVTSDGGCQFNVIDADAGGSTNKVMVSSGGVLVVYSQSKMIATERSISIGLPDQRFPVAELSGTWNIAGWDPASGTATSSGYVAQSQEASFDSTGKLVLIKDCLGLAACADRTAGFPTFVANATAGGFDVVEAGVVNGRAFIYKTLPGKSVLVLLMNDGQFIVGTRKEMLGALPAVGDVNNFREFQLNGNGTISNLLDQSVAVNAVEAATKAVTRTRAGDGRVDTITYDKPRDGLRHRVGNSCTIGGVASGCAETVQFPLQGMGITLSQSVGLTSTASAFLSVSVGKP